MQTISNIVEKLKDKRDRIKYHNETIGDAVEWFDNLIAELEGSVDDSECDHDEDALHDEGFTDAIEQVVEKVLENPSLKKRQDMIEATRKLEFNP